eukprot:SAG25_NODE_411_length_8395_cov_6.454556_4_plen_245_part_00
MPAACLQGHSSLSYGGDWTIGSAPRVSTVQAMEDLFKSSSSSGMSLDLVEDHSCAPAEQPPACPTVFTMFCDGMGGGVGATPGCCVQGGFSVGRPRQEFRSTLKPADSRWELHSVSPARPPRSSSPTRRWARSPPRLSANASALGGGAAAAAGGGSSLDRLMQRLGSSHGSSHGSSRRQPAPSYSAAPPSGFLGSSFSATRRAASPVRMTGKRRTNSRYPWGVGLLARPAPMIMWYGCGWRSRD